MIERRGAVLSVPANRRRPLWPVLEGIHAGDGQGRLRRGWRSRTRRIISPSASMTMSRTPASITMRTSRPKIRRRVRALFYGLGSRRHGWREQELDQDHRRGYGQLRAGLFRIRLKEGRRHHHLAPALRSEADSLDLPHHASELRGLPSVFVPGALRCAESRPAWRDVSAQLAVRPGRGVGPPAAHGPASRSSTRSCAST